MRRGTIVFAFATTRFQPADPTPQILVKNSDKRPTTFGHLSNPGIFLIELPSITIALESDQNNGPVASPLHCLTRAFQDMFDQECSGGHVVTATDKVQLCDIPYYWRKDGWHSQAIIIPVDILSPDFELPYRWLPWPLVKDQFMYRFPARTGDADSLLNTIEKQLGASHYIPL